MISAWFESHKYYPESARQRREEGGVKLRFRVDRFGRVLGYRLLESTGYADLGRRRRPDDARGAAAALSSRDDAIPDRDPGKTPVQPDAMMPMWYQSRISERSNDR